MGQSVATNGESVAKGFLSIVKPALERHIGEQIGNNEQGHWLLV